MAAQLYETTSGRLFHAGAVAVITVGYISQFQNIMIATHTDTH